MCSIGRHAFQHCNSTAALRSSGHGGMLGERTTGAARSLNAVVAARVAVETYTSSLVAQGHRRCMPCSLRYPVADTHSQLRLRPCVRAAVFCLTNAVPPAPVWVQPGSRQLQQQLFHQQRLQQPQQQSLPPLQQPQLYRRQDQRGRQQLSDDGPPQSLKQPLLQQQPTWQAPLQELYAHPEQRPQQRPDEQLHPHLPAARGERWNKQHKQKEEASQQQQHSYEPARQQQLLNEKKQQGREQAHLFVDKEKQQQKRAQVQQLPRELHVLEAAKRLDGREAARVLWLIATILRPGAASRAPALGIPTAEAQQATGRVTGAAAAVGQAVSSSVAATGQNVNKRLDAAALHALPFCSLRLLFLTLVKQQLARLTLQEEQPSPRSISHGQRQSLLPCDIEFSLAALVCLLSPSETALDAAASGAACADAALDAAVAADAAAGLNPCATCLEKSAVAAAPCTDAADGTRITAAVAVGAWEKLALGTATTGQHAEEETRVYRAFFSTAVQQVLCAAAGRVVDRDGSSSSNSSVDWGDDSVSSAADSSNSNVSDEGVICCSNVSSTGTVRRISTSSSSTHGSRRVSNNGVTWEDSIHTLSSAGDARVRQRKAVVPPGNQYLGSSPDTQSSPPSSRRSGSDATRGCGNSESSGSCFVGDIQQGEGNGERSRKLRRSVCSSSRSDLFQSVENVALLSHTAAALRCVSIPLLRAVVERLSALEELLLQQGGEQQQWARDQRQRRLDQQHKQQRAPGPPCAGALEGPWLGREEQAEQAVQRGPVPPWQQARWMQQSSPGQYYVKEQPMVQELQHERYQTYKRQHQEQQQVQDMRTQQYEGMEQPLGRIQDLKQLHWKQVREEAQSQQPQEDADGKEGKWQSSEGIRKSKTLTEGVTAAEAASSHALPEQRFSPIELHATRERDRRPLLVLRHVSALYCSLASLLITSTSAAATAMRKLAADSRRRRPLVQAAPRSAARPQRSRFTSAAVQQRYCSMQEPLQQSEPETRRLRRQLGFPVETQEAGEQEQPWQQLLPLRERLQGSLSGYLDEHWQTFEQGEKEILLEQERLTSDQQPQPRKVTHRQPIQPRDLYEFVPMQQPQHEQQLSPSTAVRYPPAVQDSQLNGTGLTSSSKDGTLLPLKALCWLLRGRFLAARILCKFLQEPEPLRPKRAPQVVPNEYDLLHRDCLTVCQQQREGEQWLFERETQARTTHERQQAVGPAQRLNEEQQQLHVVEQLARACVTALEPAFRLQRLLKWHQQRLQQKQLHLRQQVQPLQDQQTCQQRRYEVHQLRVAQQPVRPLEVGQDKHQQPLQHGTGLLQRPSTRTGDSLLHSLAGAGSQTLPSRRMLLLLQGLVAQEQAAQRKCAGAVLDVLARLPESAFLTPAKATLPVRGVANPGAQRGDVAAAAAATLRVADSSPRAVRAANCQPVAVAAVHLSTAATAAGATCSPAAAQASSLAWALSRLHVSMCSARSAGRYRKALDRLAAAVLSASISHRKQAHQQQCPPRQQQEEIEKPPQHQGQPQQPEMPNSGPQEERARHVTAAEHQDCQHTLQHVPVLSNCGEGDGWKSHELLPLTFFLGLKRCLNVSFSLAVAGCFHEPFFNQLVSEMLVLLRQQKRGTEESAATTAAGQVAKVNSSAAAVSPGAKHARPGQSRTLVAPADALSGAAICRAAEGCPGGALTVDLLISLLSTLGMLQLQHALLVEKAIALLVQKLQHRTGGRSGRCEETGAAASATATAATWSISDGLSTRQGSAVWRNAGERRASTPTVSGCSSGQRGTSSTGKNSCRADTRAVRGTSWSEPFRNSNSSSRRDTERSSLGASAWVNSSCSAETSPLSDARLLQVLSRVYVALARLQHKPPSALQQLLNQFMQRLAAASRDTTATATAGRLTMLKGAGRHSPGPEARREPPDSPEQPPHAQPCRFLRERSTLQEVAAIGHSCAVLQSASPQVLLALRQIIACWLSLCSPRGIVTSAVAGASASNAATTSVNSTASSAAGRCVGAAPSGTAADRPALLYCSSVSAAASGPAGVTAAAAYRPAAGMTAVARSIAPTYVDAAFATADLSVRAAYPAAASTPVLHRRQSLLSGSAADGPDAANFSNVTVETNHVASPASTFSTYQCVAQQTLGGMQRDKGFDVAFEEDFQRRCGRLQIPRRPPSRQSRRHIQHEKKEQPADERDEQHKEQDIKPRHWQGNEPQVQQQTQQQGRQQRLWHPKQQQVEEQDQKVRSMRQRDKEQRFDLSVWKGLTEADLRRFVGVFLWTFAACNDVSHDVYVQLLQVAAALSHRKVRDTSTYASSRAVFDIDEPLPEASTTRVQQSEEEADTFGAQEEEAARENLDTSKTCTASDTQGRQLLLRALREQHEKPSLLHYRRETVEDVQRQTALPDVVQGQRGAGQPAKEGSQTDHGLAPEHSLILRHAQAISNHQRGKGTDTHQDAAVQGFKRHQQNASEGQGQSYEAKQIHPQQEQLQVSRKLRRTSHSGEKNHQQGEDHKQALQERQAQLSAAEAKWFTQVYYAFLAVAADLQTRQPERFPSPATALAAAAAACGLRRETVELWKYNSCRSAHRPHLSQIQHRVKRVAEAAARRQNRAFTVDMEVPLCDILGITVDIRVLLQAETHEPPLSDQAQGHDVVASRGISAHEGDSRDTSGATERATAPATDRCARRVAVDAPEATRAAQCVVAESTAVAAIVDGSENAMGIELQGLATSRQSAPLRSAGGGASSTEVRNRGKPVSTLLATAPAAFGEAVLVEAAVADRGAGSRAFARAKCGNLAAERIAEIKAGALTASRKEVPTASLALAIEVLGPSHFCTSATPPAACADESIAAGAAEALHSCRQPDATESFYPASSESAADRLQQQRLQLPFTKELLELPQSYTSRAAYVSDAGLTVLQLYYSFDGSTALKQRLLRLSGKPCLFLSFLLLEKMDDEQLQQLLQRCLRKLPSALCRHSTRPSSSPLQEGDSSECCNSSTAAPTGDPYPDLSSSTGTHSYRMCDVIGLSCSATRKHLHSCSSSCTEVDCSIGCKPPADKCNTSEWVGRKNGRGTRERKDSKCHAFNNSTKAQTDVSHSTTGATAIIGSNVSRIGSIRHHYHHHSELNSSNVSTFDNRTRTGTDFLLTCRPFSSCLDALTCHCRTRVEASSWRDPNSCRDSVGALGADESRFSCRLGSCRKRRSWLPARGIALPSESSRGCDSPHLPLTKNTKDLRQQTAVWHTGTTRLPVLALQRGGRAMRRCTYACQQKRAQSARLPSRCGLSSSRNDGYVNDYLPTRALRGRGVFNLSYRLFEAFRRSEFAFGAAAAIHGGSYTSASFRGFTTWLQSIEWWPAPAAKRAVAAHAGCRKSSGVHVESCSNKNSRSEGGESSGNGPNRSTGSSNAAAATFYGKNSHRKERRRKRAPGIYKPVAPQQGRRRYARVLPRGLPQQVWRLHRRSHEMCVGWRRNAKGKSRPKALSRGGSPPSQQREVAAAIATAAIQLQKNYEHALLHQGRLPLMLQWLHAVACRRQADLKKQGYAQPQLALLQQLQQQKREHRGKRQHSHLLLTPQACIYAVVESIRDAAPLVLLGACPPDQAPAIHFLQLAAAASSTGAKMWKSADDSSSRRDAGCRKRRRREDARCQGLLLGQSLRAGRFEQQRVDAWLSRQWDAIQRQEQQQQSHQCPLVLYLLEALPKGETMARLPFKIIAQDRLTAWEKILASAGLPGSVGSTGSSEIQKMQMLLPPAFHYTPRSTEKQR